MFKFTGIVMKYAPIGIGAAIAVTVGHSGAGVLFNLGKLMLTLYGALVVFILFVLVPIAMLFKVPIRQFLQGGQGAGADRVLDDVVRSGTAEGDAGDGVDRRAARIVAFVMPTGYSFNLDGIDALSRCRVDIRRAGRGRRHAAWSAARDDADADGDE